MPTHTRSTDGPLDWSAILRFRLADLALLVAIIVWAVTSSESSRASAAAIDDLKNTKQDRVESKAKEELIIGRLDDIRRDIKRLEDKIDQKESK